MLLTESQQKTLDEVLGDKPEWLRIKSYRTAILRPKKAELVLELRGKNYWFPVSKRVFEKFLDLASSINRGVGLRFLQRYIREKREYHGFMNPLYYKQNKIPKLWPTRQRRGQKVDMSRWER